MLPKFLDQSYIGKLMLFFNSDVAARNCMVTQKLIVKITGIQNHIIHFYIIVYMFVK